jgi:hypothetical protein
MTRMLTCREASELISQRFERRLSWRERFGLRLHLLICDACTRFARQMRWLQAAARRFGLKYAGEESAARLPEVARRRIGEALERSR